jgi:hypothetical protein
MLPVESYINHFVRIWEESAETLPGFNRSYSTGEQNARESNFNAFQEKVKKIQSKKNIKSLKAGDPGQSFFPVFRAFLENVFDFEPDQLAIILSDDFKNVSKDYSGGVPIQISVYDDKLIFWNEGQLPENWTVEKLLTKHPSKPYNPDIANALFRSGYIESWGRGTIKIINECIQFGIPQPKFYYDMSGFWVEFRKDKFNSEHFESLGLNKRQIEALFYVKEKGKITNSEYQNINDCSRNTASNDLVELVNKELLESSGQKGAGAYYILKNS